MPTKQKLTNTILRIRNQWVILDRDIAALFGVETKRLLERCKRNEKQFAIEDYFQPTKEEYDALRSQIATLEGRGKHSKYLPFCFTKKGVETLTTLFKKDEQRTVVSEMVDEIEKKENEPLFKKSELRNDLVTYVSDDGKVQFDVKFDGDTVWLTQQQIATIFETTANNVTKHFSEIFKEKELDETSVCEYYSLTGTDGKTYKTKHYNLKAINRIGFRIRSKRGIHFRDWVDSIIHRLFKEGYVVRDHISDPQLNDAKNYIDNRVTNYNITVGDISIKMKGNKLNVDMSEIDPDRLSELIEELETKVKGTILEPVVQEGKKSANINDFVQDIIREESWFRKTIDYITDTKETIQKISSLFINLI